MTTHALTQRWAAIVFAVLSPPGFAAAEPWTNHLGMKFVPFEDIHVSVFETRVRDFEAFWLSEGSADRYFETDFAQGPDHPVVNVRIGQAREFCDWLTRVEAEQGLIDPSQRYRLPTDAEWSRFAGLISEPGTTPESRDGKIKNRFPWGVSWPPPEGIGNFADASSAAIGATAEGVTAYDDGFPRTAPVGSFQPNRHGLFDLAGNVWEFVEDDYTDRRVTELRVVMRGGSWRDSAREMFEISHRNVSRPTRAFPLWGFRVVLADDAENEDEPPVLVAHQQLPEAENAITEAEKIATLVRAIETCEYKMMPDEVIDLLERAAGEDRHLDAASLLAKWSADVDERDAMLKWNRVAAGLGDLRATTRIGLAMAETEAPDQDWKRAIELLREAAAAGEPNAVYYLGECLLFGKGVNRAPKKAVEHFSQARESGHAKASLMLGTCYAKGIGVAPDFGRAADLYREAVERGAIRGYGNLAVLHLRGRGVEFSPPQAVELFRKGADLGDPVAAFYLGRCHEDGIETTTSRDEAESWILAMAEENGNPRELLW